MTSTDPQDSNGGNSGPNSLNGTEGRISSGYSINGILGIQHSNDPNVNTMKRKRVDDHGEYNSSIAWGRKWMRNGRKTHAFPVQVQEMKNMKFPFWKNFFLFPIPHPIVEISPRPHKMKRQLHCWCISIRFRWMSIALVVHRKARNFLSFSIALSHCTMWICAIISVANNTSAFLFSLLTRGLHNCLVPV